VTSITAYQTQALASVKQALNMSMMRKVLMQDAQSVQSNIEAMEKSVTPHLGRSLDIKV